MRNHVFPGWTSAAFGDVLSHRKESGKSGDELLSVTAEEGVILQSESGRRNTSSEDKSSYKRVHPGDVVYNTMRMWQGVSGTSNHSGIVSPAYTVCTPKDSVDSLFLAYLLKHPDYIRRFRRMSQGLVSDTWNLKFREFANIPLLLPPPPEQRKIAEVLDAVGGAISSVEMTMEGLNGLRLAQTSEQLGRFDSTETVAPFVVDSPKNGIYKHQSLYGPVGTPILRIDSFGGGDIFDIRSLRRVKALEAEIKDYGLRSGDVVVNRVNSIEHIGKSALVQGLRENTIFESNVMRLRFDSRHLDSKYISLVLSGASCLRHFRSRAKSAISQASINKSDVLSCPIPVPSLEEQRRIVSIVAAHDERIAAERARLEKLRKLKAGLMDDLLTGRVRVDQLEDLPV